VKGLRIGDVDLLNKTLTIRRISTKTDAGARVVPLNINANAPGCLTAPENLAQLSRRTIGSGRALSPHQEGR
jgi:hypothetical protein